MRELRRELEREDEMNEDEKVKQPEVEREMVETREPVRAEREYEKDRGALGAPTVHRPEGE